MINQESGKEINPIKPAVIITSLLYLVIVAGIAFIIAGTINEWQTDTGIKILIGLMAIKFYLDVILFPTSAWVVKLLEALSENKKIIEALDETIEKETPYDPLKNTTTITETKENKGDENGKTTELRNKTKKKHI